MLDNAIVCVAISHNFFALIECSAKDRHTFLMGRARDGFGYLPVSVGVICFCNFSSCAQVAAVTTAAAIIEDGPVPAVRCMLP